MALYKQAHAYNAAHARGREVGPLGPAALRCLRVILDEFDHNGFLTLPLHREIAVRAHCSQPAASQAMVALEAAGLLTRIERVLAGLPIDPAPDDPPASP
jgi:DNA-binding MarR family transcriptional regulator